MYSVTDNLSFSYHVQVQLRAGRSKEGRLPSDAWQGEFCIKSVDFFTQSETLTPTPGERYLKFPLKGWPRRLFVEWLRYVGDELEPDVEMDDDLINAYLRCIQLPGFLYRDRSFSTKEYIVIGQNSYLVDLYIKVED